MPEPIEVKVFGPIRKHRSDRAAGGESDALDSRLVDVFDGIVESIPEQAVVVDNTSAAHYGLSADDIRSALESVIQGTVATNVLSGDRLVACACAIPTRSTRISGPCRR